MNTDAVKSLDQWLDNNLDAPKSERGKYWFPLTLPTFGKEEIAAATACMCDYQTSMGATTREFEKGFAAFAGAQDAVMVNSGSSADLLLAFHLVNPLKPRMKEGDEILVPAVTWPTQVWSPLMAGLKVKLVDVDPQTLNIDFDDLRSKITSRTKCLFAVHLMGYPCDMQEMQNICDEHGLLLIEDCCESIGAKYDGTHVGNFGIGGTFSFFFSHHMTTMEGGMVICNSEEDAEALRVLRAHGWSRAHIPVSQQTVDQRFQFINWGFNLRPTELNAAFGLEQLKKLDAMNERRDELAQRFDEYIDSTPFLDRISMPAKGTSCPLATVVRLAGSASKCRVDVLNRLEEAGVETRPVVTGNLARQPAAKLIGDLDPTDFPGAEEIHHGSFYVGLNPMFDDVMFERMIRTLDTAVRESVESSKTSKVA
ncbi:DegT/DnrJ/EryC1/StrS family aminotransferase [Rhodopirellula sallentina]|uniref:DegT/DnrJ/EryC1/StrS aminotransferase n=1 Tax=Rhodopirellula sallentina SM41 TaxID=1263870 RepID=M5U2V9_9BACT|nr:DegT/DnrJ/EryC1/StrS family aminotransferase [Rhodopirellula sallentina]EMI55775.1 DegT/DnrJ/EryC1/StrS aminotransferase [Rhodopirellula sallentina SM41]